MRSLTRFVCTCLMAVTLLSTSPRPVSAAWGELDLSFGSGGRSTTDFSGYNDEVKALVRQPDGKIVAAGMVDSRGTGGGGKFGLARYQADGSLDPSFGAGGKVTTALAGVDQSRYSASDVASALVLQPDGKLVAAGTSMQIGSSYDFTLARYNAEGSLDPSFGTGGSVTTDFSRANDVVHALVLQPDGKLVAAGFAVQESAGGFNFALARYNADGSLDPSFGDSGKVVTDFFGSFDMMWALVLQPDGRLVAGGATYRPDSNSTFFTLVRYNPDGTLDTTFGDGGKVMTDFGPDGQVFALARQPDGKIVAAGLGWQSVGGASFALARYDAEGALDTTFGIGGRVTTDFSGGTDMAKALALQPDGKIVAAGIAYEGDAFHFNFGLARYNADGSPDATFGNAGKLSTDFAGSLDDANALALLPEGKLVVAGNAVQAGSYDFALARYHAYNQAPIADAGPDQTVEYGASVTLDGSRSYDPEGDQLTFEWFDGAGNLISAAATLDVSPALGSQTFTLAVADQQGARSSDVVTVTARDTTPPALDLPDTITAEASSRDGAAMTFEASANDNVGVTSFACVPASGSTFALGTRPVTCAASDAAGHTTSRSFNITILDTTPPAISSLPPNISVSATSASGAVVDYTNPAATDLVDGAVVVSCSPLSGGVFPVGATEVTCSATDARGNSSSATFGINVITADLAITNTAAPVPVNTRSNLTYSLIVINTGPGVASNVTVSASIPAGTSFVGATAGDGAPCMLDGNGLLTCGVGNLTSGASATVTLVVFVTAPPNSSISNTTSVGAATYDPRASDNVIKTVTPVAEGRPSNPGPPGGAPPRGRP